MYREVARPSSGCDATTHLQHFSIVTYCVDPVKIRRIIHPRFKPYTIEVHGHTCALLSVVPFKDVNFTSVACQWPKMSFGQTNYRIYIIDQLTNERAVWFLGTVLHSWWVVIPRIMWKMPWHFGRITFDCDFRENKYMSYHMRTESSWAGAELKLEESAEEEATFTGFADLETALVVLTHPFMGYYHRSDSQLGTYQVWHERLQVKPARCLRARFELLDRLGLVPYEEQNFPHSVWLQNMNKFIINLPPQVIKTRK